eukprot:gene45862-56132_t
MGSLRIEKRFPIWGRDIGEDTSPIEAGLGWTVRPKTADYPGKAVVERQKAAGPARRLVLLEFAQGAELPAMGAAVLAGSEDVGKVTSTAYGHTIDRALAMAYVSAALASEGQTVVVGGASAKIRVTALYDPKGWLGKVNGRSPPKLDGKKQRCALAVFRDATPMQKLPRSWFFRVAKNLFGRAFFQKAPLLQKYNHVRHFTGELHLADDVEAVHRAVADLLRGKLARAVEHGELDVLKGGGAGEEVEALEDEAELL